MHPILLTLGPFTLYSYGLMMVIAFATVTWVSARVARSLPAGLRAISAEQLVDFSCYALLGGMLGGRLFYVALRWEEFAAAPGGILAIWRGGLVWYGGFIGGLAAAWWYVRSKRLAFLRVLDQFIPFLALGHALGRIGCFLNGCCYGRPTGAWCGVLLPGHEHRVLPTQLFEALGLLFLYITLRGLQRPAVLKRPGRVFGAYLIGYAILRFFIEGLRGDQPIFWAGFTLQQVISMILLMVGLWLITGHKSHVTRHK